MPRVNSALYAFNRGILSRHGLARIDLKRAALSAEVQTNWMPRLLGSMMLRPGWGYVGGVKSHNRAVHLDFVYAHDDTALLELTDSVLRVRVDEAIIARPGVNSAVSNGGFNSDLSNWSDDDEAGASSQWQPGGYMALTGTGFNAAIRTQQVTVAGPDRGVEHALRVVIARGEVTLKVGSSAGADDYVAATLRPGTYSLAFTPSGNFYIRLSALTRYRSLVDSVAVEGAGDLEIPSPWDEADLPMVRWTQSGDVVFCASGTAQQQRRILRFGVRSWGLGFYEADDGPFRTLNATTTRLTPSATAGDVTLTASAPLFRPGHVGGLFRLASAGQRVDGSFDGEDQFGGHVRVTGVGTQRKLAIAVDVSGLTGTLTLQRSLGEPGSWTDVGAYPASSDYNDTLDNQIAYYRIGIKAGDYGAGTATATLTYASGSLSGVVRVTGYSSPTSVAAAVLKPLGGTDATADWEEGEWSDHRGWPTAVDLYEGRLWWAGRDRYWGSVSDAFASFDDTVEGDSGPISRSIGKGPVDRINWLLGLQRLVAGGQGAEHSARSTTFDEPLTPTNFNIKQPSTRGSAAIPAVRVDARGVYVGKSRTKLYLLEFDPSTYDYASVNLTELAPDVGRPRFARIAVQADPDTRIHAVRADGTAAVMIFDAVEEVKCWVEVETDGVVEDVVVLPGDAEDRVYYTVRREVDGEEVRYLERWAEESECVGGPLNKQADSFATYEGPPTTTLSAPHLAGREVVAWGDGRDLGTFTLDGSGEATLAAPVSAYVVGLYYRARFKSAKLALAAAGGTALAQRKKLHALGLILLDTHARGLRYGGDFGHLDDLPRVEKGAVVDPDHVWEEYDHDMMEFNDSWGTDSRLCLQAAAPRPCTVSAAIIGIETNG